MKHRVRRLTACVLACGLAAPGMAKVSASPESGDHAPCGRQSDADGCASVMLLASAGELAGLGLGAQPLPQPLSTPAPSAQGGSGGARQLRITEIASLRMSEPASVGSPDNSAPALFWVFGSGLLGAAFIARRRKPARRRA